MKKITFWDIIEETLKKVKKPLSSKEIWDNANDLGITKDFESTGKTPWATIGAYLYTDISRAGDNSKFVQTSERPAEFFLREMINEVDLQEAEEEKLKEEIKLDKRKKSFNERDLHSLLVAFASADTHFRANLKTIFHENSKKAKKGMNEWLHPDMVGVYFPYKEFTTETLDIQRQLAISSVKIFSFEIKIKLNFSNLREYYFQAVSNSSWANEGYLVTLNIEDDSTLLDEIRRLNNAFGIGIIKLNASNIYESEILFPAQVQTDIDWETANRLAKENVDFRTFLSDMSEDIKLGKIKSNYDEILSPDDIDIYLKTKKFAN
tara:strand:+ start:73 stop:1035 length:963 start_codon:yes stop_codon:yes gene_type:complete